MIVKDKINAFNNWIKKHRLFALSAPIMVLLVTFFISTTIKSMSTNSQDSGNHNGYNKELPNQDTELTVENPNELYKRSQRDSAKNSRYGEMPKSILDAKKENDSLQQLLEELEQFSFDGTNTAESTRIVEQPLSIGLKKDRKTKAQEKLEYIRLLADERKQLPTRNQDYTAPPSPEKEDNFSSPVSFKASIYRDQWVLPKDFAELILKEDVYLNGQFIPKNTRFHASVNFQGSLVLLNVSSIDKVKLDMVAMDSEYDTHGIYHERAGELIQEFKKDMEDEGIDLLGDEISKIDKSPLTNKLSRVFVNNFSKKKYRENDKILLVNGYPLIITTR